MTNPLTAIRRFFAVPSARPLLREIRAAADAYAAELKRHQEQTMADTTAAALRDLVASAIDDAAAAAEPAQLDKLAHDLDLAIHAVRSRARGVRSRLDGNVNLAMRQEADAEVFLDNIA